METNDRTEKEMIFFGNVSFLVLLLNIQVSYNIVVLMHTAVFKFSFPLTTKRGGILTVNEHDTHSYSQVISTRV